MDALFWFLGAGAIMTAGIAFARGRSRNAGRRDGGSGAIWFDSTPGDDLTRRPHEHSSGAVPASHGHDGGSAHCHHDSGHDCGGGDAGCDCGGGDGGGGGD